MYAKQYLVQVHYPRDGTKRVTICIDQKQLSVCYNTEGLQFAQFIEKGHKPIAEEIGFIEETLNRSILRFAELLHLPLDAPSWSRKGELRTAVTHSVVLQS